MSLNQPLLIEIVEQSFDVCFKHIVHVLCHNRLANEPHDVMITTFRPKPKGAVEEMWLVDFVQHTCHDVLNQLAFVCGNTQRPLFALDFRNVRTPYLFGYVFEKLHAVNELNELLYPTFSISLFIHTVDTDRFSAFLMLCEHPSD